MLLARATLLALLIALAGCPQSDLPTCHVAPADAGGGSNDVEAVLVAAGEDGTLIEVHDGTAIPLVFASSIHRFPHWSYPNRCFQFAPAPSATSVSRFSPS